MSYSKITFEVTKVCEKYVVVDTGRIDVKMTQSCFKQAVALIREGQTVSAIKIVREDTGIGLKEAKHIVDSIIHAMKQRLFYSY